MEARTKATAQRPPDRRPPDSASASRKPRVSVARAAVITAAVCLVLALGAGSAWAYNYGKFDLTWYTDDRDAAEFTISTAGQMQAFSALVNGDAVGASGNAIDAVSFEGRTVKLANGIALGFAGEFTPVGTEAHPFAGTFDGQGNAITGLSIKSGTSDIGLFGVTGEGSVLRNVAIDGSGSVELTSAGAAFEDVGSLVGECRGSVENCSSAAKISVNYTAETVEGPVMRNIGGVAGSARGPMAGTSFSGSLRAETPANAYKNEIGNSVSAVVVNVGGVVGVFAGELSGCSNAGTLLLVTSGASGIDRFGNSVDSKSLYVGGVGGYGEADVTGCRNTAPLFTTSVKGATLADMGTDAARSADGGGDGMGGIVGALRAIAMSGLGDNRGDGGLVPGAPVLTISDCSNTGYVSGLHAVGGIVGAAGSKTVVTRCVNGEAGTDATANVGHVRTTRWNKPAGGGIAGQSWGVVSYSRNHGVSENTKTGYYTAGIVGMLQRHDGQQSDPEVFACYNTGNVYTAGTSASFYEGGIVGENDGDCHVHDNVFLSGTVSSSLEGRDDEYDKAVGRNYGTVSNSTVVYETPRQALEKNGICIASGEAVAVLNKLAANSAWKDYYLIAKGTNKGYPVLNGEASPDGAVDLASVACTVEFEHNAKYTAAYNPTPGLKVTVTVDGKVRELVQGADYKVVADPDALDESGACKGITGGEKPYRASIEGIGNYYGTPAAKTAYGIDRGSFAECTVSVVSAKWTGGNQNRPAVTVADAGGSVVDPADYAYTVNDGKECVAPGAYPVAAEAKESSNYEGRASGTYLISPADIYKDTDIIGLVWGNRVWYYDEGKNDTYEVIPADAQGNALPEGANLVYDEKGLPYVVPQTYTDAQTGQTLTRTTYDNGEGQTLTVAEAKRKDAEGKPVYGDMAFDFTGEAIRPACIGVLYPVDTEGYDPRLLPGVGEDKLPEVTDIATISYIWRWGVTSDGGYLPAPRNVNATTSETQPEASVVVNGNRAGSFSNYAFMDFRIKPIAVTADNLVAVQKENSTLPYSAGARPADPQTTRNDLLGNVNSGVEVRYAPDPDTYDADDPATYRVLDGANWKLEFDYATDEGGNPIGDGQYAAGSKVYYKVIPTESCSLTGWTEKKVDSPFVVDGSNKVDLNSSIIKVEVQEAAFALEGFFPVLPPITVTNSVTGATLVRGQDYDWSENIVSDRKVGYDPEAGCIRGSVVLYGRGEAYAGARVVEFTLEKADIASSYANGTLTNNSWTYADPENDARGSSLTRTLVYRTEGWTASQLSEVLSLHVDSVGNTIDRGCFTVAKIEQNGVELDKITDLGKYTLTVECDNDASRFFCSSEPVKVELTFKKSNLTAGTRNGLNRVTKLRLVEHEFMYTGYEVAPELIALDGAGDPIDLEFSLVWVNGKVKDPGDYNVPSTDPTSLHQYRDLRVTGDGTFYSQNLKVNTTAGKIFRAVEGVVDLSFSVVAADISDSDKVRVAVGEAYYAGGAAVEPAVTFYDTDGNGLNYTSEDYSLSYRNNTTIGSAAGDTPPTVIITLSGNGKLSVGGDTSSTAKLEVPFTIKGEGTDVGDAAWDYAKTIVVHPDGTLSQPGIVGTSGGAAIGAGSYSVETGTYGDGAFSAKADGWKAGDEVWFRVTGIEEGVCSGTAVLGPATAQAASAANTFGAGSAALKAASADTVYTGAAADPAVTATDGGAALVEGRDFKVECSAVNAGAAAAKVSGLGAYAGSVDVSFAIAPAAMADLEVQAASKTYSGKQLTLDAADVTSVVLGGVPLPAADWAVKADGFGANVNVEGGGTGTLVPGTSGNLAGEKGFAFVIDPAPLVNDELEIVSSNAVYTGTPVVLGADTVTVRDTARERDMVFGTDFVIAGYADNVNAGTATVYLSGAGNYSASANTVTKAFEIAAADFSAAQIAGLAAAYDWRGAGNAVKPAVTVTLNGVVLPAGDYAVSYGANDVVGAGTGTVAVEPRGGNVAGEGKSAAFGIAVDLARATVEAVPNGSYEPGGAYEPDLKVSFNGIELEKDVHYTVAYDENPGVGEKVLTVSGVAPCTGKKKVAYGIVGKPLADGMVSVNLEGRTYTGSAVEPAVSLADGSYTLVEGTDYEVVYDNNVNATGAGEPASITVTGKGNYAGVLTRAFSIAPKRLSAGDIAGTATATGLFAGAAVEAAVAVSDAGFVPDPSTGAPYALVEGTDYTVSYAGNAAVGTATAKLAGMGNYAGELALSYVVRGDLAAASLGAVAGQDYTGSAVEPALDLSLAGVALVRGTDYTVAYADNVQPGTALATATGMGFYEGTKAATFSIAVPSYTDPATGVTVSGTALRDLAADGAEVRVIVKALTADDALMTEAESTYATDRTEAFLGFSVVLQTVKDGVATEVKDGFGTLAITLPVGNAYNGRTAAVAIRHTTASGAVAFETQRAVVAGGRVAVTVDRLSEFFVAVDRAASSDGGTAGGAGTPAGKPGGTGSGLARSGDGAGLVAAGLAALAAAALAALVFPAVRRKTGR